MGKNGVAVIVLDGIKWLSENHIEDGLDHEYFPVLTRKYLDYRKNRCELVDEPEKQPNRIFWHEDFATKIIMDCRTQGSCKFKRRLGFRLHDVIFADL